MIIIVIFAATGGYIYYQKTNQSAQTNNISNTKTAVATRGPGGFGGGQGISPEQIATAQARRAQNGGGGNFRFNSTPSQLIEALIKLLQERAAPSP